MNVFEPLITYSSPSLTARVLIPDTSEPGVGLGDAQAQDRLAADRRRHPLALLLLGAERQDRRHRHVGLHGHAHRQAAGIGVGHLLRQDERAVIVAALPAVLLGLVETQEPQLAHAREHRVGERRLLPLLGVRRELFDGEAADRLAQLFVLVGEDDVFAPGLEIGLQDRALGGRHRGAPCVVLVDVLCSRVCTETSAPGAQRPAPGRLARRERGRRAGG